MSKRLFLALALLVMAGASSVAAQSSFIVDNRSGTDILVANGSTGDVGIGQRDPSAQLDILSDEPEKAFQVQANSGDIWYIDQNGDLKSTAGPRIQNDSNIDEPAFTDLSNTYVTSGVGGASDYDIVLDPSGEGRVNVSSNLNMRDNNITNFFDTRCGEQEVVDSVNEDGTYTCVNVSSEIDIENLSETLEAGNVANQTINMTDSDIINIGKLDFDNGRPEVVNPSQGTIKVRGDGGSTDEIFEVLRDSKANTALQIGNGNIGSAIRNPTADEDIVRYNQSGGSNVEIPNGYLNISNDNNLKLDNGNIDFQDAGNDNFVIVNDGTNDQLSIQENVGSSSEPLRIRSNGSVQVRDGNLDLGDDEVINLDRIDTSDTTNLAIARDGTDELVIDSSNLNITGNDLDNVGGTTSASSGAIRLANGVYIQARNSADGGDIQVLGVDTGDNVQLGGNGNVGNLQVLNSQLNITQNNAIEIGYGDTKLYEQSLYLSDGYGNDGLNISSSQGIRVDAGGPSSDGNLEFSSVGVQEDSGELELTGGNTQVLGGNLNLTGDNITDIEELQDYYDSEQCGEFQAVKGIYPNGTYICTEEILEEETEYLNQTLAAGNTAGDNDIYMNSSQIFDIGNGLTNFTNDGGLDLGGDIEMNRLNIHNTENSLALDFDSDKVNVRGGLDIENDSVIRDDQELEIGSDTNYDLRLDSANGELVLRNGSDQVLVADSNENLRIENGDLNLQENNITNVGSIQDNSQDSLIFHENNSVVVPNGNLDLQDNNISNFFKDNCPTGEVIERVNDNGSYQCVNVTNDGEFAQNLEEVLEIGNKAGSYDINMTDQDIVQVDRLETNESGNYIDGDLSTFSRVGSGGGSEIDVLSDVEMNGNTLESNDGIEFNISDLQAIKDGFEVENGDVTFNNSNGLKFLSDTETGSLYMDYSQSRLVLKSGNTNQQLEMTDSGEFIFNESNSGGNTFEINSEGSGADGALEIGNSGGEVPLRLNGNEVQNVDLLNITDDGDSPGKNLLSVGDNTYLTDIDQDNTLGIQGVQNSNIASVQLGSSGPTVNGETSGDTTFSGNVELNGNNVTEIDQVSGNSGEAIESQNDVNMSENDVNEAKSINFGGGDDGKRLVKSSGGDLCLGDQCSN